MDDVLGYAGRHVVVTGAASGMGDATAQLLLDLGANVTAIDVNPVTRNVGRALHADLRDKAAIQAATLITEGKRLNCITPGPTATAMMPHFVRNAGQSTIDAFVGPIGRQATPQEQAWPLVFLNSPRASYVNGETFTTDGGFFGALQTGQVDLSAPFAGAGG